MHIPQPEDFATLAEWGLIEDPHAAIADFSENKSVERWNNDWHCRARQEYIEAQSEAFVTDTQAYYRSLNRPIDRTKWEYLKRRKGWFHPPVEWDQFTSPGVSRIIDFGCGDGDITQRVADYIAANWLRAGYEGFPMEIVGIDVNESRLKNARTHTESPHERITLRFEYADILNGLEYEKNYFDYGLTIGFFEIFDGERIDDVIGEVTRVINQGVYIRDVIDEYPGMYPRPELDSLLRSYDFPVKESHKVLKEPFVEEGTSDPLEVWPMDLNQVLFAQAESVTQPEERY